MPTDTYSRLSNSAPLVSVVTPFYNTREYLAECIESVLNQGYRNWEYILVDNHSTDGSSEVAAAYAARFPEKIRLIRPNKFLAQVPNYNFALSCISAASKYTKMVQADDWIYPECLERMVAVAESDPSIGMVSSHYLRGSGVESHVEGHGLPYSTTVFSGREVCRLQLRGAAWAFGSPTVLLYRSTIIRNTVRFFDENSLYDDTDAHYRTMQEWNLGFVHQVLSFLRVHEDSIRSRLRDYDPDILDTFVQLSKFGPIYLQKEEATRLLEKGKSEYYRFLAHRILRGSSKGFWRYHNGGLKSIGLQIEKTNVFRYICWESARMLTNPGRSLNGLYHRFSARMLIKKQVSRFFNSNQQREDTNRGSFTA
jgi:glycosyltransferase involved in cell wall biosynthesis